MQHGPTSCPGIKIVLSLQSSNCSPHWCGNPGTKRPRQYEGVGDVCHSRCDTPPHLKQHNSPTPGTTAISIQPTIHSYIYILTQYQHPFWQCYNRSVLHPQFVGNSSKEFPPLILDGDSTFCTYNNGRLHRQNWQELYLAILSIRVSCPTPVGHSQCSSLGVADSHPSVVFCMAVVPDTHI